MEKGIGASKGIGIGNVIIVQEANLDFTPPAVVNQEKEWTRCKDAVSTFIAQTNEMVEVVRKNIGEQEARILEGQVFIVSDPMLTGEIENLIGGGACAEEAISKACDQFIAVFSAIEDEMMRHRATDIADIKVRIMKILLGIKDINISEVPKNSVIVVKDLTPSMTTRIVKENIVGFITETGSETSHSAILARALQIPAVLSVTGATKKLANSQRVIVDGTQGIVIPSPSKQEIVKYESIAADLAKQQELLKEFYGKRTMTLDGHQVELFGNIGSEKDVEQVLEGDGEGIGLFRTEFLYMNRTKLPTEEEQFKAYSSVLAKMKGKPVIIRTLDVGGDKEIPYLGIPKEENPFLGYRAIRLCLDQPNLYKAQLRALLRAGRYGNLKIMVPMITRVEEIRRVKKLIQECEEELKVAAIDFQENIPLGIMIETPAACQIADLLAKEVKFFSIGTNDLTQYMMAVDRGNAKVVDWYSVYHPAVLRAIRHVIACAKAENIMVGMCGESAADPKLIPLLLAFGLDEFSVNPASILEVRKNIHEINLKNAWNDSKKMMEAVTKEEVLQLCGIIE